MLGFVTLPALFAGCSDRTDFFPDDPRAGTGGTSHAAGGQAAGGGASAQGGTAASGAQDGSGGSVSGSANGGEHNGGGAGTSGSAGTSGRGASGGASGDGAGGEPGGSGEAGASGHDSGGTSGEPAGGSAGDGGTAGHAGVTSGGQGGTSGGGGEAGESCIPAKERCDGVDDDCNGDLDEDACPSGCEAKTRDGHVYVLCLYSDEGKQPDYLAARERCAEFSSSLALEKGFELARVEDAPENDFLKAWIAERAGATGAIWFGANDREDERMWVYGDDPPDERFFTAAEEGGGTPYMERFNDFASGRPNSSNGPDEDCGAFDAEVDWQWNDVRCSVARVGFVCEGT